jgi:hypothetical protein
MGIFQLLLLSVSLAVRDGNVKHNLVRGLMKHLPIVEKIDENFIKSQHKLIQEVLILYLQLNNGYWNCKGSFEIWRFMMTNDLNGLNKRFCGLNAFDEFYANLNGSWGGDR